MQSKTQSDTHGDSSVSNFSNSFLGSQLWFNNTQSFNPLAMRDKKSDSSSLELSINSQSRSEGGVNEDNNIAKLSKGSNCEWEGRDFLKDSSTICVCGDNIMQPPHLELVAHSIACPVNSHAPYGGMMAAYGQPSVPFVYDMHQARMILPMEMAQEPVYVNAKQYHGILRRRQARAKAELEKKLIKVRKPYLHESRHQHALRRARGSGGRFAKKSDTDTSKETQSISAVSLQSLGHSCNNDVSSSRKQNNSAESVYQREEGRASDQQWRSFMSNRALAMQ